LEKSVSGNKHWNFSGFFGFLQKASNNPIGSTIESKELNCLKSLTIAARSLPVPSPVESFTLLQGKIALRPHSRRGHRALLGRAAIVKKQSPTARQSMPSRP
jgi:hypothetical protein